MKRNLKDEQGGVAGFFLDVPVLLFVIVAITIFTAFFSQTYLRYRNESQKHTRDEICLNIKNNLKGFHEILEENENGVRRGRFSEEKLNRLNNETLNSYLRLDKEHSYNVLIENDENEEIWIFGNERRDPSSSEDVSSYQIPILLTTGAEQPTVGRLKVMVW